MAPCKYLGIYSGQGDASSAPEVDFEIDPAMFGFESIHNTNAKVWYEWEGVQRDSSSGLCPHRVCVDAKNIAFHGRPIPQNPFGRTAPR
eukprot:10407881-Karenia_brevis.AAC.1